MGHSVLSVSTNLCVGSVLRPRVFLHGALFFDVRADAHKCRPAHRERRCGLREVKVAHVQWNLSEEMAGTSSLKHSQVWCMQFWVPVGKFTS